MNRRELAVEMFKEPVTSVDEADKFIQELFLKIQEKVKAGEEISIPKFGKFVSEKREARKGRNPSTGEVIDIGPKVVFKLKQSDNLKTFMNE